MGVKLSDRELFALYCGTLDAKRIRNELNTAENLINSFLKRKDNAKKYLYITNPDGTRFKIEYGAKFENYSIAPFAGDD